MTGRHAHRATENGIATEVSTPPRVHVTKATRIAFLSCFGVSPVPLRSYGALSFAEARDTRFQIRAALTPASLGAVFLTSSNCLYSSSERSLRRRLRVPRPRGTRVLNGRWLVVRVNADQTLDGTPDFGLAGVACCVFLTGEFWQALKKRSVLGADTRGFGGHCILLSPQRGYLGGVTGIEVGEDKAGSLLACCLDAFEHGHELSLDLGRGGVDFGSVGTGPRHAGQASLRCAELGFRCYSKAAYLSVTGFVQRNLDHSCLVCGFLDHVAKAPVYVRSQVREVPLPIGEHFAERLAQALDIRAAQFESVGSLDARKRVVQ